MFLRKTTTWPNGQTVAPVDQHTNSASRRAFSKVILARDPNDIGYVAGDAKFGEGVKAVTVQ
jgi:hypothetical protein